MEARAVAMELMYLMQCHKKNDTYIKLLECRLDSLNARFNKMMSDGKMASSEMYLLQIYVTMATRKLFQMYSQKKWDQVLLSATRAMNGLGITAGRRPQVHETHQPFPVLPDRYEETAELLLQDLALMQGRST